MTSWQDPQNNSLFQVTQRAPFWTSPLSVSSNVEKLAVWLLYQIRYHLEWRLENAWNSFIMSNATEAVKDMPSMTKLSEHAKRCTNAVSKQVTKTSFQWVSLTLLVTSNTMSRWQLQLTLVKSKNEFKTSQHTNTYRVLMMKSNCFHIISEGDNEQYQIPDYLHWSLRRCSHQIAVNPKYISRFAFLNEAAGTISVIATFRIIEWRLPSILRVLHFRWFQYLHHRPPFWLMVNRQCFVHLS